MFVKSITLNIPIISFGCPSGSGEVDAIRYLISHADVDALADLPEKSADSDSDSDLFIGFA